MAFQQCPRPFLFSSSSRIWQLQVLRRDVIRCPAFPMSYQLRAFHPSKSTHAKPSSKSKRKSSAPRNPPPPTRQTAAKGTVPSHTPKEPPSTPRTARTPSEPTSSQTAASPKHSYEPKAAISFPAYDPNGPSAYFTDPLNAPASTLPPPLDLPSANEFDSKLKYWYSCGKKYLVFYKTGIKALWSNRKILKALGPQPLAIQALLRRQTVLWMDHEPWVRPARQFSANDVRPEDGLVDEHTNALIKLEGNRDFKDCDSGYDMIQRTANPEQQHIMEESETDETRAKQQNNPHWRDDFTRAELQFRRRTARDIRKAIPFGLILLLCGEWTPLIVAFISSAVPRICWIPAQSANALRKEEARRAKAHQQLRASYDAQRTDPRGPLNQPKAVLLRLVNELKGGTLRNALWSFAPTQFILRDRRKGTWVPFLRHLAYLDLDDSLIMRDGGVSRLTVPELRLAAAERAIDIVGRPDAVVARDLEKWMEQGGWRSILNHSDRIGPGSESSKE